MNKFEFFKTFDDKDESRKKMKLALVDFKMLINDNDYEYSYEEDKEVENFLKYKFLGKYDCDKIFGEMFDYGNTDTMNSFWTIFKQYIKLAKSNEFDLENGEIKSEYIEMYKQQYNFELTNEQLWIAHILNLLEKKNITFNEDIKEFAEATHRIGNFMKVPTLFNKNRYANTLDYFDITLLCIYKWFETSSDFWLEILLNNDTNAIENAKNWFSRCYTSWKIFVIVENLNCFVDENLKPLELFKNHFNNFENLIMNREKLNNYYEKAKLLNPQNVEDLLEGVRNINDKILSRGQEMIEYELKNSNEVQREFDKLIVTNKTNIEFPIVADVMNWDKFYELATSDEGMTVKESFFDIDLLDKDTYEELKLTGINMSFFRISPMYITEKILEWKV